MAVMVEEGVTGRKNLTKRRWEALSAFLYLLPTIIGLIVLSGGAVIFAFVMSFCRWDLVRPPAFVGLGNYVGLLNDEIFLKTVSNTATYAFGFTILVVPGALLLAVLLNQRLKGIDVFRTLFFLPYVSNGVAVAVAWGLIYNADYGLINWLLGLVGITGPRWLADTTWALRALIIVGVWQTLGSNAVIFLAGLQNIPDELYEAARIDGAGFWARFRYVTMPLISPTTFFVLVLAIIGSFQVFEVTYVLTKGGPYYSTLTLVYDIYRNAFQYFHMGAATAEAYILFAIILVLTLVQFYVQKYWVHYEV
jgi:multiple sugar transport system permease protein